MRRFDREPKAYYCPECGTRVVPAELPNGCGACGLAFDASDPLAFATEPPQGGNPAVIGFDDAERVRE